MKGGQASKIAGLGSVGIDRAEEAIEAATADTTECDDFPDGRSSACPYSIIRKRLKRQVGAVLSSVFPMVSKTAANALFSLLLPHPLLG